MPPKSGRGDERQLLKRYLSQYYKAKEKQRIYKSRLESLQAELRHPAISAPALDGVSVKRGKHSKGAASLPLRIAEIEDRIQGQAEIEARVILEIMDTLDFLPPDSTERYIMELRHIDCMSWADIQRTTHLSRSPCFDYYNKGLDKLLTYGKVVEWLGAFEARQQRTERDGY